jgi:hypothetical protein
MRIGILVLSKTTHLDTKKISGEVAIEIKRIIKL